MPDEKRLTILLTNDDGYQAEGINVLADYLEDIADVRIVAPKENCSMIGDAHSDEVYAERLTRGNRNIHILEGTRRYPSWIEPPRQLYYSHGSYGYTKYVAPIEHLTTYQGSGTPVDCVNYALRELYKGEIDIVISGINHGYNLGYDFQISGTMAAACEAALRGKVGIAISAAASEEGDYNFELAAEFCRELVLWISHSLSDPERKTLLTNNIYFNLNVPALPTEDVKGLALTFLGSDYIPEKTIGNYSPSPYGPQLGSQDIRVYSKEKLCEELSKIYSSPPKGWIALVESDSLDPLLEFPVVLWEERRLRGGYGSDQWAIEEGKHLSLSVLHSYINPGSVPLLSPLRQKPFQELRGIRQIEEVIAGENGKMVKKTVESLLLEEFSLGPHKLERFVEDWALVTRCPGPKDY